MTEALVPLLEASGGGAHVVSDLRSVTVVGRSAFARAISRGACAMLGLPCTPSGAVPR